MIFEIYKSLRQYWRIYLLVIVTTLSLLIIFNPLVPGLSMGSTDNVGQSNESPSLVEEYTGMQFSIELGGGTRIRAPLHGVTAEGVNIGNMDRSELENNVSGEFTNLDPTDVSVIFTQTEESQRGQDSYIEITSKGVSVDEFQNFLNRTDISYDRVREGVTEQTRDQAISVLQNRISASGLSGGSVRQVNLQSGESLILIEVSNLDRQDTIDLITRRGEVRVDAYYYNETQEEYVNRTVLVREDFRTIGSPTQGEGRNPPNVPVTIESTSAEQFEKDMIETGVARPGGSNCIYDSRPNDTEPCLLTVVDDDVVYSAGMAPSLAQSISNGQWSISPDFVLETGSFSEAQNLSINLQSGGLPTPVDIDSGDVNFVSPEQGEQFRLIAFLVGVLATLAVATSVSIRYGELKIAGPMLLTALVEVIVILSIAVILSYPIDVAVIAGIVAVIGTGVDDLIIITDRIMGGENPASSSRIFNKRFKIALWIILSAAGTTILALGPLAVLELRELQGFAIFTIIGVIAGVLLTRPAFGDMLRYLYTNDKP